MAARVCNFSFFVCKRLKLNLYQFSNERENQIESTNSAKAATIVDNVCDVARRKASSLSPMEMNAMCVCKLICLRKGDECDEYDECECIVH